MQKQAQKKIIKAKIPTFNGVYSLPKNVMNPVKKVAKSILPRPLNGRHNPGDAPTKINVLSPAIRGLKLQK
ncbi:hypothetical protein [Tatumella citrea]|uniref:hypothetical protein n=1 Tax=Tatumella citrea TaxID=53336 RepID=UPI0012FC3B4A|nr:hypothetical protein [Tatumella citrea]